MSPCAYVAGLLHQLVMRELDLPGHGFRWMPAVGGLFVPFEDGSSIQLWNDDERCEEEIRRFAPGDLAGWRAMQAVKRRLRDALRPDGADDLWIDPSPDRDEIERRLARRPRGARRCCSSGRWWRWSSATWTTSGCTSPTWGRA